MTADVHTDPGHAPGDEHALFALDAGPLHAGEHGLLGDSSTITIDPWSRDAAHAPTATYQNIASGTWLLCLLGATRCRGGRPGHQEMTGDKAGRTQAQEGCGGGQFAEEHGLQHSFRQGDHPG